MSLLLTTSRCQRRQTQSANHATISSDAITEPGRSSEPSGKVVKKVKFEPCTYITPSTRNTQYILPYARTLVFQTTLFPSTINTWNNIQPVITNSTTIPQLRLVIIIFGVVPLRGFPVGRRGIGCRVPILSGRWLAGLVRLVQTCAPSVFFRICYGIQPRIFTEIRIWLRKRYQWYHCVLPARSRPPLTLPPRQPPTWPSRRTPLPTSLQRRAPPRATMPTRRRNPPASSPTQRGRRSW